MKRHDRSTIGEARCFIRSAGISLRTIEQENNR